MLRKSASMLFLFGALAWPLLARAEAPRVLPEGKLPDDRRLGALKDLDGYFPFTPPKSREEWEKRAERVRRQTLVALGLWPMPARTPPNAVIHGRVDRDGYTVEKVYLESYPGHYVTGSLYRPKDKPGKLPGILCPHGHWNNGRFHEDSLQAVRQSIVSGGERFEVGGRYPLQSRCVQLARMGCVVFHYDMLGYADSVQIPFEVAHRFAKQRPQMSGPDGWGLFSAQAELRLQSVMGLQTYNSIRALDWLTELPDVDAQRIGVTGASGGGTQTFILAAIDPRVTVAFPAVMVSTAMQGGCTCENATYLRVGTGNIELAALIAPRPLGMTAADDWTKDIATKGLPELKQLYALLGAEDRVMARPLLQYGHNYNYVSRAVMYGWMNKHLKLGLTEPIVEEDFKPLSIQEMTVWDDQHPRPAGGEDYERSLLRSMDKLSQDQIGKLLPFVTKSPDRYRELVGGALDVMIGRRLPEAGSVQFSKVRSEDIAGITAEIGLLRYNAEGEELPLVELVSPKGNEGVVIWIDAAGKDGLFAEPGKVKPSVAALLAAGMNVVGVDLVYQGEFLADGKPLKSARRVINPREFAGYTYGYNPPLFAQRVHDILSVVAWLHGRENKAGGVHVVGMGRVAGPLVAAARAQAGAVIDKAAIGTGGFHFADLKSIDDPQLLPGAVKYGDVWALLALSAPHELWFSGLEPAAAMPLSYAYLFSSGRDPAEVEDLAEYYQGEESGQEAAAVEWLLK